MLLDLPQPPGGFSRKEMLELCEKTPKPLDSSVLNHLILPVAGSSGRPWVRRGPLLRKRRAARALHRRGLAQKRSFLLIRDMACRVSTSWRGETRLLPTLDQWPFLVLRSLGTPRADREAGSCVTLGSNESINGVGEAGSSGNASAESH